MKHDDTQFIDIQDNDTWCLGLISEINTKDIQYNNTAISHFAESCSVECHVAFYIMLRWLLSVVLLGKKTRLKSIFTLAYFSCNISDKSKNDIKHDDIQHYDVKHVETRHNDI